MTDERFWPDHTVRCIDCGRSLPYLDARNDNWRDQAGHVLPQHPTLKAECAGQSVPVEMAGLCWRDDRKRRGGD